MTCMVMQWLIKLAIHYIAIHICMYISILYRCRYFNATNSKTPKSCDVFYSGNSVVAYYDDGMLPDILEVLDDALDLLSVHSNVSDNYDNCANLIGSYLCHYYFPACLVDKNEILPVCSGSCNLLLNDEECSDLFMVALSFIAENNITHLPDIDSCAMTYRSLPKSDQPNVCNSSCLNIEG